MINPENIRLVQHHGSFTHRGLEYPADRETLASRTFTFAYRRPFLTQRAISFGARGVTFVTLDDPESPAVVSTVITKSNNEDSPRNFHHGHRFTPEEFDQIEEFHGIGVSFQEVARTGVVQAIQQFQQRHVDLATIHDLASPGH
jgi:hypothetical protein